MFRLLTCLTLDHDWRLVILAGAICVLASLAAISLFHRAQATTGRTRLVWLGLDASAAGCGIWATHFIAMLAYDPGGQAKYDLWLTAFSLVFAAVITGAGLYVALRDFSRWAPALGGAVVGCGVAVMHFTGMLALDFPGRIAWSAGHIEIACACGVAFAGSALFVAAKRDSTRHIFSAAGLFALAILSMHFTAMSAVTVIPDPAHVSNGATLSPTSLALFIAGAAAIVLGMCLIAALVDRRSQDLLGRQKVLLDTALENMSQGLCMFDATGRVVLFNERYTGMMDLPAATQKGRSLLDLLKHRKASGRFDGDPDEYFADVMAEVRAGKTITKIIETPGGRSLRVIDQPMQGGGWVATFEDITEWRKAEAQLSYMAHHDALTDLPNRTKFRADLEQALRRAKRDGHIAVLCLDLDHFKNINDTLGHPVGDALLTAVASRLKACVRESDTVSRLGGDEFAIVQIGNENQASEAALLAGRLVEVIGAPYEVAGHQIVIGLSIGIALAPADGCNPDELLKNADMALYRAKADGRATYRFFEAGMDARAQVRRLLEVDLRAALLRNEFELFYQPIHDLKGGRIISLEALIRWNHPLRGMISPLDFIPLAEETGMIIGIGDWVLRQACMDAAGWSQDVRVAVNLSPAQFKHRGLVQTVMAAVAESGLDAKRLELEITELVLLQDNEATLAILHKLREFGVRISMDDFGTGYSSLSYLRSFPFDKIKIDRSFITELASRDDFDGHRPRRDGTWQKPGHLNHR